MVLMAVCLWKIPRRRHEIVNEHELKEKSGFRVFLRNPNFNRKFMRRKIFVAFEEICTFLFDHKPF